MRFRINVSQKMDKSMKMDDADNSIPPWKSNDVKVRNRIQTPVHYHHRFFTEKTHCDILSFVSLVVDMDAASHASRGELQQLFPEKMGKLRIIQSSRNFHSLSLFETVV